MDHFSDRRHRLNSPEVPSVMRAVFTRLQQLVEERSNFDEAKILYGVLKRMDRNRVGRPHSERVTWETIEKWTNSPTWVKWTNIEEGA